MNNNTDTLNIDVIDPTDPMGVGITSEQGFNVDPLVGELSGAAPEVENETPFDAFEGVNSESPDFTEINDSGNSEETETESETVNIPKAGFNAYKMSAIGLVETIDSIAQGFLPNRSKSSFFESREELNLAKQLYRQQRNQKDLTPEDLDLIHNYEQWQDYCDSIPMTTATKESISQPLAEILAKRASVITPEARLLIAVGGYALPLAIPLFKRRQRGL